MSPFKYGMIVAGENYCPRPELSRQFALLVKSGQNVVVQGERRMGKTSFVCETIRGIRGMRLLYVDLYCVKTIAEFCRRVVSAVSEMDRSDSFLRKTARMIGSLRPMLTIDRDTGAPALTIDSRVANTIASVEEVLDMIAAHAAGGRCCVVFDEFQDVMDIEESDMLLARLRAKIQFQNDIPHVFLGSVRNRMHEIFGSPSSPFFKSAMSFSVDEIDEPSFVEFLLGRFRVSKRKAEAESVRRIIVLADHVSGDVQELCEAIWLVTSDNDRIGEREIKAGIDMVLARESRIFGAQLSKMTPIQAAVLRGMADRQHPKLFSGEFLSLNGIKNVGSVTRALKRLVDDDLVYEYQGEWKFTNPFFREWILRLP